MITVHVLTRLLPLAPGGEFIHCTTYNCSWLHYTACQSSIPEPPPPQTFKADEGPRGRRSWPMQHFFPSFPQRVEAKQQPELCSPIVLCDTLACALLFLVLFSFAHFTSCCCAVGQRRSECLQLVSAPAPLPGRQRSAAPCPESPRSLSCL